MTVALLKGPPEYLSPRAASAFPRATRRPVAKRPVINGRTRPETGVQRSAQLAIPSANEGLRLPVLEAMARGCPVAVSNRSGLPGVCGNAALLAGPDDPSTWFDCVIALFKSEQLRRDLGGSGHLFSWQTSAEGHFDIVEAT